MLGVDLLGEGRVVRGVECAPGEPIENIGKKNCFAGLLLTALSKLVLQQPLGSGRDFQSNLCRERRQSVAKRSHFA